MSERRMLVAVAAAWVLGVLGPVACTGTASNRAAVSDPAADSEQRAVDALALKNRYPDVITGTSISSSTLDVYVDLDKLYSMDEQSEASMRSNLLQSWKRIWSRAHPRQHRTVRVSVRDYYGKEVLSDSGRV